MRYPMSHSQILKYIKSEIKRLEKYKADAVMLQNDRQATYAICLINKYRKLAEKIFGEKIDVSTHGAVSHSH